MCIPFWAMVAGGLQQLLGEIGHKQVYGAAMKKALRSLWSLADWLLIVSMEDGNFSTNTC